MAPPVSREGEGCSESHRRRCWIARAAAVCVATATLFSIPQGRLSSATGRRAFVHASAPSAALRSPTGCAGASAGGGATALHAATRRFKFGQQEDEARRKVQGDIGNWDRDEDEKKWPPDARREREKKFSYMPNVDLFEGQRLSPWQREEQEKVRKSREIGGFKDGAKSYRNFGDLPRKWAKADAQQGGDDGDGDLDDIERRILETRRAEDDEADWARDQLLLEQLMKQERRHTGDFMDELDKATACSEVFVFINKFLPTILAESAKASEADGSAPSRKAAILLRTTELGRLINILATLARLSRTKESSLTPAMADSQPMAAVLSRLEEILKEVAEDRRHRSFNKFSRNIVVKISKLVAATRGLDKEAPQVLDLVPAMAEVIKVGAMDDWELLVSALEYDVLQEESVLRDIAPTLTRKTKYFQPDMLARLSRVFAKGKTYHKELFEAIALYSKKRLKRFQPRQVVMLVRNLATLRHYDEELMEAVAARVSLEIESYRPFELLLFAWSCGRLRFKDNRILLSIARSVAWNIKEFTGQEVAFVAIAFSKLSYRNDNFLAAASEKVTGEVDTIDVTYLCLAVYSFSKLEHTDNDFFDAAAQAFLAQGLEKLTTKELSITIWGYANSRWRQNDLLDLFAKRVAGIASTCSNAQLLCTAMWGFARLQERNDDLIDAVILRSKVLAPSFATEDFAMLTYGMARFQEKDIDLLNQLARLMVEIIEDFSEMQLMLVARAYAQLGVKDEALFKSIVEELMQKADRLDLDLIVDVCWSLSQVGLSPVKLLELAPKMLQDAQLKLDEGQVDLSLRKQIGDLMWLVGELPAKDVPKGLRAAAKAHSVDVPVSTPARFIVSS